MQKILLTLALLAIPVYSFAAFSPVQWSGDFSAQILQPLQSFWGANVKGSYFTATSTTATSTFGGNVHIANTATTTRGVFDINNSYQISIGNISSGSLTIGNYGSGNGNYVAENNTFGAKIYAYKTISGKTAYSATPLTVTAIDDNSFDTMQISISWSPVSGATGYLVKILDPFSLGTSYDMSYSTTSTSVVLGDGNFYEDEFSVALDTTNTHYGPDLYIHQNTGDMIFRGDSTITGNQTVSGNVTASCFDSGSGCISNHWTPVTGGIGYLSGDVYVSETLSDIGALRYKTIGALTDTGIFSAKGLGLILKSGDGSQGASLGSFDGGDLIISAGKAYRGPSFTSNAVGGSVTIMASSSVSTLGTASNGSPVTIIGGTGAGSNNTGGSVILNGGIGSTTGNVVLSSTGGNVGIGTTSPGTLLSLGNTGANTINISATATSTWGSGHNIRTGCFAINGTCVGDSSNRVPYTGATAAVDLGTQTFTTTGLSTFTDATVLNNLQAENLLSGLGATIMNSVGNLRYPDGSTLADNTGLFYGLGEKAIGNNQLFYFDGNIFVDSTNDVIIRATLKDGTVSAGSNGDVLSSTGTGVAWVATSTLGLGGGSGVSGGTAGMLTSWTGATTLTATGTPTATAYFATSTTATSTLRGSLKVGSSTTAARGIFDVNNSTAIGTPTGAAATINYGSGNYTAEDFSFQYRVYAYKTVGAQTMYSSSYSESTLVTDDSSFDPLYLTISWNPVSGATGYRVLIYNSAFGAGFQYYYDTTGVSFVDGDGTEASFVAGNTVTPTSIGPDFFIDSITGYATSTNGASFTTENILTSTKASFPAGSVTAGSGVNGPGISFADYPLDGIASRGDNMGFWQAGTLALNIADVLKQYRVPSNYSYSWAATTDNNSSADTALVRGAANTVYNGLTATGNFNTGKLFAGGTTVPTAKVHLGAGTTAASTAPLKFTTGSLMTTAEAGAVEFLTDKYYGTITTGAARKELTLNDTALTSGTIPVATTNGRLQDSGFTTTNLTSGTYTPTLTNTTNVAASTARLATYMRVGNTVTVSGQFDIDPTAPATATLMGVSLPVASAFTTAYQLGGTTQATAVSGMGAGMEADATNDRASVRFISSDINNRTHTFTFSYQII